MRYVLVCILYCLAIVLFLPDCKKNKAETGPSAQITSFRITHANNPNTIVEDITGQIVNDSIYLGFPEGTNLTSLVPAILYSGARLVPSDSTAQNFSNPVIYTVTATNGSTVSYVVAAKILSDSNLITSFVFKAADNPSLSSDLAAIIQGDTIILYTGDSTNLSHLVPSISYTGVKMNPGSGTAEDFSSPVYYSVTAQDGAIRQYTVVVSMNKVLYIGSDDGNLYALNAATGMPIWKFTTGGIVFSIPTIANGILYFGGGDGYVYAVNASNGTLKWSYWTEYGGTVYGIGSSPTVNAGIVYINGPWRLLALDAITGNLIWSAPIDNYSTDCSPTVANGVVYDPTVTHGTLNAYNAATGSNVWTQYFYGYLGGQNPAIANGMVYGFAEGTLAAWDESSGQLLYRWPDSTINLDLNNPTVSNGIVYVGANNGGLYALDASNLTLKWQYGSAAASIPTVGNGQVFTITNNAKLCALNASNGSLNWSIGGSLFTDDANMTFANNILYVGSDYGNVRAINASTGALIWSFQTQGEVQSGPLIVDASGNSFHPPISGDQQ